MVPPGNVTGWAFGSNNFAAAFRALPKRVGNASLRRPEFAQIGLPESIENFLGCAHGNRRHLTHVIVGEQIVTLFRG